MCWFRRRRQRCLSEPPKWNYTHFNAECDSPDTRSYCMDIRMCKPAAASLVMGGWPAVCGWIGQVVPKVCCSYPLVLGGALMRKIDEEKKQPTDCGPANCSQKPSQTEQDFYHLLYDLPDVNKSDSSRFDPPLDVQRWTLNFFNGNCYSPWGNTFCMDIRICTPAVASIALGGWPTVCGWVDNVVPRVCCGMPLVLGKALVKKVLEERKKASACGLPYWMPKLSQTEHDFYNLLNRFPVVNETDPSNFDPTLGKTTGYEYIPGTGVTVNNSRDFPWMVSIWRKGKHLCGGSLISNTHILSAAHCFVSRWETLDPSHIIIHTEVGSFYVTKIIIHENFIPGQYYNDIAILKLERGIPSSAPICLMPSNLSQRDLTGANTTMLVWGYKSFSGAWKFELQIVADIPVVTNEECRRVNGSIAGRRLPKGITDDFICAGLPQGDRSLCQLDSGNPLMLKLSDYHYGVGEYFPRWSQVGITTFSVRCGDTGFPGLYTRVSSYLPWISENIKA